MTKAADIELAELKKVFNDLHLYVGFTIEVCGKFRDEKNSKRYIFFVNESMTEKDKEKEGLRVTIELCQFNGTYVGHLSYISESVARESEKTGWSLNGGRFEDYFKVEYVWFFPYESREKAAGLLFSN